jgi:transposase
MMTFTQPAAVYLHVEPIDFRKQINGLSLLVQDAMQLDIFSEALFVFMNRPKTRIKILYWDKNGFCLWVKRLEKDKFSWPKNSATIAQRISEKELQWLLDGFDIFTKPPHKTLHYSSV